jgi:hypothetical protein
MKEGLTGGPILLIVVFFILLFVGIMSTTLNRANASGVKNDVVQYIKNYRGKFRDSDGIDDELLKTIKESNHYSTGKCSNGYDGYDRSGTNVDNSTAVLCVKMVEAVNEFGEGKEILADPDKQHGCYYMVQLFYSFYIPMVSSVWSMKVTGQTPIVYNCS